MAGAPSRGARVELITEIDSTNSEGLRRAAAGERGPLWIRALRQINGRGRRGREWRSERGNLFASLIITPRCDLETASQLAFVTGIALHEAIASLAPEIAPHLLLKWPNDILLGGAKLGGILIETSKTSGDERATLVIGVGLNVGTSPDQSTFRADHLARHAPATADGAMAALAGSMKTWIDRWALGSGFAEVRAAWLMRTVPADQPMRVAVGDAVTEGRFAGIDEKGALLLRTREGERRITAGDVFLR